MNKPALHLVRTRERTIELALEAMQWAMSDRSIPQPVRYSIAKAHTALHACRSPETVARLEREQGLR
ncbi:MAG TPA: hypothetical protein VFP92_00915 [Rhodanobacteraceae bacterium]|nr:hypothetical protein [Rhodanobacteraceae bacterium]